MSSSESDRPGGPIDPWSEYDLHDVIAGRVPAGESTSYEGLHLVSQSDQGDGRVIAQPDGHIGHVATIEPEEYDDVLELVDELNRLVSHWHEFDYQDDKEALIEWAGKLITGDKERAESNPDRYAYVPDDWPDADPEAEATS